MPKKSSQGQHTRDTKKEKKKPAQAPRRQAKPQTESEETNQIDLSATIPVTLQQLLLNVFRSALLNDVYGGNANVAKNESSSDDATTTTTTDATSTPVSRQLDIKTLIQTIKSHLYNRDFDSAFTDANEDLLRAYALRWSASRALGYAGVFRSLLKVLMQQDGGLVSSTGSNHVVCIGGGAGAEIVALAAAWRDLVDEVEKGEALSAGVAGVSLDGGDRAAAAADQGSVPKSINHPALSVTAVDIADWSSVGGEGEKESEDADGFAVRFRRSDVLSISEEQLKDILHLGPSDKGNTTVMVTLMFTLNELFSTSMAKATAFLLRTTDLVQPGTLLLVVDSPGSYSTLKLGKGKAQDGAESATVQERKYPMKFLLDHTLLSVAEGKWEQIYSQDSRWWRRDVGRLGYDVGEGAGLEDMRYQVHIYRRLAN
ncbi:hypothetical protein ANOM_002379 [Aspergillus nomiae NRRL 13137]|uniref:25S rRNA (Uridine(2843)-N(3))-methyltransferase n=1 Tax=Aspergillus nomiae NRRL (strain ATCC 15546 / NRRL 13137 / CBS 260.88 / M93) TaxID=1509407 RepID=A0A0L1JD35_ASPN3|nr:uncharacterized protein ANOM_002379 [Aspergillus nomiae NRRL 13137]KNG89622.1 hypothetical protein ANOM_002379 [Aspergillus nomiae NRRL 13137]